MKFTKVKIRRVSPISPMSPRGEDFAQQKFEIKVNFSSKDELILSFPDLPFDENADIKKTPAPGLVKFINLFTQQFPMFVNPSINQFLSEIKSSSENNLINQGEHGSTLLKISDLDPHVQPADAQSDLNIQDDLSNDRALIIIKNEDGYQNILKINGNKHALCALYLGCSDHFTSHSPLKDYRLQFVEQIQQDIKNNKILDPEHEIFKPLLKEIEKEQYEFEKLVSEIGGTFESLKIVPLELGHLIQQLRSLNIDIVDEKTKFFILLKKIEGFKSQLESDSKLKKVSPKIIAAYEAILSKQLGSKADQEYYFNDKINDENSEKESKDSALEDVDKILNSALENSALEKMKSSFLFSSGVLEFKAKIYQLSNYGEGLKSQGIKKGGDICDLAKDLIEMTDSFFVTPIKNVLLEGLAKEEEPEEPISFDQLDTQLDTVLIKTMTKNLDEIFKPEFEHKLNSKMEEMNEYRADWQTITANILIALTGIGLFAIAGQLIYSKIRYDRPFLFFSSAKTHSANRIETIKTGMKSMKLEPSGSS